MKYLDMTLTEPEANLALDEALLDWCEAGQDEAVLRFWESHVPFVVVGYANHVHREVRVPACQTMGIPILRRCTGGGTVVQGPGCLNYALIFPITETGPLSSIPATNRWIMNQHRELFQRLLNADVEVLGHTDLVTQQKKFSGNAQRRKRRFLLFHGTFLLDFNLGLIERCLLPPSRQPDYRAHRSHTEFLRNVSLPASGVKNALRDFWNVKHLLTAPPANLLEQLLKEKYSRHDWHFRF